MMLAWLSSSERIKSSLPRMLDTVPALAREAGLEDYASLYSFEGRDLLFELYVNLHRSGDGADGSGAYAIFFVA